MWNPIGKVAVIGAGVMGAGIAAQVANAGLPVVLLDDVPGKAEAAIALMPKANPSPLMSPEAARLMTPGSMAAQLPLLSECDWIIEAVVERLEVKRSLYQMIDSVRKPGGVVSSNTSTLPLSALTEGMPQGLAKDFLITHFFNPPRFMRLLEVVSSEKTIPEARDRIALFADERLGKTVVFCRDRPGFIANRLGVFWLQTAVAETLVLGIDLEEADAALGPPMGIPKSGVFGLLDLVGLDLMPMVGAALGAALPATDPLCQALRPLPEVERLIAQGHIGRKGRDKSGFYRLSPTRKRETMDFATGLYRPYRKPEKITGSLRDLLRSNTLHGRLAWRVLGPTLAYAASLVGDAADRPEDIDLAMRLGYNWKEGPFALIDRLGSDWLAERLAADAIPVPPFLRTARGRPFRRVHQGRAETLALDGSYQTEARPLGVLLLEDIKATSHPILRTASAALWDVGDGVASVEFTSKMNTLDGETMDLLNLAIERVQRDFQALLLYNETENFSVGVNLGLALFAANIAAWHEIENLVKHGQTTFQALKYAPFPVVGAPSGLALGGGCEILLHCDAIHAHAETYMGLVEIGAGMVPAWGGCLEMLRRWSEAPRLPKGPMPAVSKVFEIIATATVAKSAFDAKTLMFLRPSDTIVMNRSRLLAEAKTKALALVAGYTPPPPPLRLTLPGESGKITLLAAAEGQRRRGKATDDDMVIIAALAEVLCGGKEGISNVLELERREVLGLLRREGTLRRMERLLP